MVTDIETFTNVTQILHKHSSNIAQ